jgi:outer membrane receptor protein involved in Fe transport
MFFILLLANALAVAAQGSVKGKIFDKTTNEALELVTVSVTAPPSQKIIKGSLTDNTGAFLIEDLKPGNYVLNVSYVGYIPIKKNFTISDNKKQVNFPHIMFQESAKTLKGVEVVGQRSTMKLEVDKKTFSVDQAIATAGGSASDVLQNIPSIEIDNEGTISLRGNTSVQVWINGKASGLTSDNRGEILEQLPAENIERIEVITNPSAKYNPEGSAGIINIVLKENRKAGYYGSLQAGGNDQGGYNASGNINYSSRKIETYVNAGFRHRKNNGGAWSRQDNTQSGRYQNYNSDNKSTGSNFFGRAGLTWHATKTDDLGISGMTMIGNHKNTGTTPYHNGTIGSLEDASLMFRKNKSDADMRMYHGELNYVHKFSDKHNLDVTLTYDRWKMDNDETYRDSTTFFQPIAPTTYSYQYRPTYIRNRSWEARIDYTNQINDAIKIEAGYDGRINHENSPQESYIDSTDWNGNNQSEDKDYFNRFIYDQNTQALYATFTSHLGKLGVQVGLRGEYWKVKTNSYNYEQEHNPAERDPEFNKDYFQLFPSVFLSYSLAKSQELQLNYTRRLQRPWGGQLNSFKNTRDASLITFGNPQLTPEYTNSFELNYIKNWNQHTLSLSAYYRPTTDVIQQVKYQSSTDGLMYATNMNVAKSQSTGLEVVVKNKLFRILDLTSTVNAYYYKLDGFEYVIDGQTVTGKSDENFSWNARLIANVILPWNISGQVTGNYNARQVITQGYRKPNYSIDLGFRKTFLDKKYALALNVRDLLNSRKFETVTHGEGFTRHQKNWRSGRRISLTFTYSFGNMKAKKTKQNPENNMNEEDATSGSGYGEM